MNRINTMNRIALPVAVIGSSSSRVLTLCGSKQQQLQFTLFDRLIGAAQPIYFHADSLRIANSKPVVASNLNCETSLCFKDRGQGFLHPTQQAHFVGSCQGDALASLKDPLT